MLVAMVLLAAGIAAARLAGGEADATRNDRVRVASTGLAALFLVVLVARSTLDAVSWLALFAASSVSMSTIRHAELRTIMQSALVIGAWTLLVVDQPDPRTIDGAVAVLGPVVLLVAVTVLASSLAGDLERSRRRELATRRAADRRSRAARGGPAAEPGRTR